MKPNHGFYQPATIKLAMAAIILIIAAQPALPQNTPSGGKTVITVPAGTRVPFAMVRPVASKSVKAGETVYLQTTFPVLMSDRLAIPAGTFVQGILADLPIRSKHEIELPMNSVVMIFGDGSTITASGGVKATVSRDHGSSDTSVLDVGAPGELVLSEPLVLEEKRIAEILRHPRRLQAVHDRMAASRPAQNPGGTCYTPEIPPKPAKTISEMIPVYAGTNGEVSTYYESSEVIRGVPAKPGTPYPCP
jgi:hypothetical protein